jgi:hypothetical protein
MDVNIGEVNSTVRATDHSSLAPETLERIVRAVLERLREQQQHDERAEGERRLNPGVSAPEP